MKEGHSGYFGLMIKHESNLAAPKPLNTNKYTKTESQVQKYTDRNTQTEKTAQTQKTHIHALTRLYSYLYGAYTVPTR